MKKRIYSILLFVAIAFFMLPSVTSYAEEDGTQANETKTEVFFQLSVDEGSLESATFEIWIILDEGEEHVANVEVDNNGGSVSLPDGMYNIVLQNPGDAKYEGYIVEAPQVIVADGMVNGKNEPVVITFTRSTVHIAVTDEDQQTLSGAKLQLLDGDGATVAEWESDGEIYEIKGLKVDTDYTIRTNLAPEGYVIPDDVTFHIDGNDVKPLDVTVMCQKIDVYYIPLKSLTYTYGEPWERIIDTENVTCNGEPYYNEHIGQAFYLEFEDGNGKVLNIRDVAVIPAGTYTVRGMEFPLEEGEKLTSRYTFNDPVTVTINPKSLTPDMFTVTAEEKWYDGTTDVTLNVTIRKENSAEGIAGLVIKGYDQGGTPVYDEVTAVISGKFADPEIGENKTITYTITALEGKDAGNYILPEGGISGTITNGVIRGNANNAVSDSDTDSDTDDNVSQESEDIQYTGSPQTGDNSALWLGGVVLLVSGMALLGIGFNGCKRKV